MKTLVLGGGVVGVTTAYFLAKAGHEVTILEEKDGLGLEASAGNAGIIAPGHSFAWASPRARRHAPPLAPWRRNRHPGAARARSAPVHVGTPFPARVHGPAGAAEHPHQAPALPVQPGVLNELARAEGIEYDAIAQGALYLYRDPAELEAGVKKMALLAEHGQKQEILDANAVARLDPVFEPVKSRIAGAIRDLGDASGDSRLFTEKLGALCRDRLGVGVKLGARIIALRSGGDRIDGVVTNDGVLTADSYVLALGVGSPIVARTVGVSLPIYPAKGYSSTFPLRPGGRAPIIPGVDERWLVAWSRLGDRLRLTSTAEFAGYDWGWTPRDFNNILRFARDVFPEAVDFDRGEYRACLRPMTPDGPPSSASAATAISSSTAATGTWAGPWPAAPPASSPIS